MARNPALDAFKTPAPGRFRLACAVRYNDMDANGHVNHARYMAYLEEARIAFRGEVMAPHIEGLECFWPLAHIAADYHGSATHPATVEIEVGVLHVGRTSFSLGYGIFEGGTCLTTAETRSVCVDRASGRSRPLPDGLKDALAARLEA